MNPTTLGLTLSTIGEILLAITVLFVHHQVKREKKIDSVILKDITYEEIFGSLSILLIIIGYLIQAGIVSI